MQELMRTVVVHKAGALLTTESVSVPAPELGELLVKAMARGVCDTDLHAASEDWPVKPSPPFFISDQEAAGNVVANNSDVRIGYLRG